MPTPANPHALRVSCQAFDFERNLFHLVALRTGGFDTDALEEQDQGGAASAFAPCSWRALTATTTLRGC